MTMSQLDAGQIIKSSYSDADQALKVIGIGGSLVPSTYDEIDLTYVAVGNGAGQIQTATYKLSGNTIATLTLTYDSSDRLSTVVKS